MSIDSTVLPILGYVVGSVIVAYLVVRGYRYVRQHRNHSVVLPRPVYENVTKKSRFSLVRATGWDWQRTFSIPWNRWTYGLSSESKPATTVSSKNLSVDLLPTTALPPPPSSIPTQALVDLGSPSLLDPPVSSRLAKSTPSSPKRLSRSFVHQPQWSPHGAKGQRHIQHPAFPRPPSPHALLATTPPQKHQRSRSLGGVPVRRLSGGQSGLRNKVEIELSDFIPGHSRGTSGEHLLIDFSSPESGDKGQSPSTDGVGISPAASDIGVLPVLSVDRKVVHPRPMPLVDIGDDVSGDVKHRKSESEDDTWMWFGPNTPSTIRAYDARLPAPRLQAVPLSGVQKFAFPVPLPFPKTEMLVDLRPDLDEKLGIDAFDSSKTLVEVESIHLGKKDQSPVYVREEKLVDVGTIDDVSPVIPIDPFSDDFAVNPEASEHQPSLQLITVDDDECQPQTELELPHHPLSNAGVEVKHVEKPPQPGLLFAPAETEVPSTALLSKEVEGPPRISIGTVSSASAPPTLSPIISDDLPILGLPTKSTEVQSEAEWRWIEAEDPWSDHIPLPEETSISEPPYKNTRTSTQSEDVTEPRSDKLDGLAETSQGASLLPTVLDGEAADDEVPELSLDDLQEIRSASVLLDQDEEEEEDVTPRPTPASIDIQLPALDDNAPAVEQVQSLVEESEVVETYPDPDLLPLPVFVVTPSNIELNREIDSTEVTKVEPRPSSQIPTPPASPPTISPVRLSSPAFPTVKKAGKSLPSSPRSGPKGLAVNNDMTKVKIRSRPTTPPALKVTLPFVEQEKLDNSTPIASVPPSAIPSSETAVFEPTEPAGTRSETSGMEVMELDEDEMNKELEGFLDSSEALPKTSLPGSFPDTSESPSNTLTTIAGRLATRARPAPFHPSVRSIVRQPVEIALAMQLRPGLGAGADPAWMVRFLMSMFGWFAVLVSGQENY